MPNYAQGILEKLERKGLCIYYFTSYIKSKFKLIDKAGFTSSC